MRSHETASGNTSYPSCFRNGFTRFRDVSVYGFFEFRPVGALPFLFTLSTPTVVSMFLVVRQQKQFLYHALKFRSITAIMTKCKLINSATEKQTGITSWVKFNSLELSVFALKI